MQPPLAGGVEPFPNDLDRPPQDDGGRAGAGGGQPRGLDGHRFDVGQDIVQGFDMFGGGPAASAQDAHAGGGHLPPEGGELGGVI